MDANPEFRSTISEEEFLRGTARRVIRELVLLVVLIGFFWSSWSEILPNWLELVVGVTFASYIVMRLLGYPKAKRIVTSLRIRLLEDALEFTERGISRKLPSRKFPPRKLPYDSVSIAEVLREEECVSKVILLTKFRQKIELARFDNMDRLHCELSKRIDTESRKTLH